MVAKPRIAAELIVVSVLVGTTGRGSSLVVQLFALVEASNDEHVDPRKMYPIVSPYPKRQVLVRVKSTDVHLKAI